LKASCRASFIFPSPLKPNRCINSVVLVLGLLIASGRAQSTIHVPTDAPTIQRAIDAANNGDTVLVAPGTYNENIDFKGKAIVLTSGAKAFSDSSVGSTIINGSVDGPVVNITTNEPVAATLNGFTIQNGHASGSSGLAAGGIFISNASPQITNNIITNNLGCGIHVVNLASPLIQGNDIKQNTYPNTTKDVLCNSTYGGGASGTGLSIDQAGNVQVIGNIIEDNVIDEIDHAAACGAGVRTFLSAQVLLQNNTIRNNHSACDPGIDEAEFFPAKNFVLIQNLIYGNNSLHGLSSDQVFLSGTIAAPYPSFTEINNTIYGGQELVLIFAPSVISNNVFVNTSPPQLQNPGFAAGFFCADPEAQSSPITISHNDIFNTGQLQSGGCTLGPGNLAVDPLFLNLPGSDFHTQPASPIVAAGDINAPLIPAADLDGKARTVCGTIDMGVYEIRPHPPITLTGSPQTAPGQSNVTFTATVTGNCNVPTGVVTFLDGAIILGSAPLNSSGVATFDTSFLFVGTHPITATYPGDFNFEASTSNTVTEVITGPPTNTVLNTVSPNPARPLQAITMTATVTSAFTTPMENISFIANGTVLATVPLTAAGTALATVSTLHSGTYNITAVYGGSTEYAASTSNTIIETVLGTDTANNLTAAPNPALPGQTVTLTAAIFGSQTGIPLTGTVTFKDGAITLAAVPVGTNGVATFNTSALLTGSHPITASYGGSADYNSSVSNTVNEVVTAIPTMIGLNVSPNPATVGQSVTMTATAVSNLPNQTPIGIITFSDQSGVLGTATLVAGVAAFSTSTLTAGTHQVTAALNPTGSFAPSTSSAVTELITAFDFAVTASATSLNIPGNGFQIISVTITPSGGFPRAVNLSCSQAPLYAECVFAKSITDPLSKGPQTVKLTVSTSSVFRYGNQVGALAPVSRTGKGASAVLAGLMLPTIVLLGLTGKFPGRFDARLRHLLLAMTIAAATMGLNACSGRLPLGTPPGDYVLTVIATDTDPTTALSHKVVLKLHVPQ
jgi:parallel beta-helix repeat protein